MSGYCLNNQGTRWAEQDTQAGCKPCENSNMALQSQIQPCAACPQDFPLCNEDNGRCYKVASTAWTGQISASNIC